MTRRYVSHCVDCATAKPRGMHGFRQRCTPCDANFYRQVNMAQRAIRAAINRGQMTSARGLTCVDCGGVATDWEHRDYSKPLDVQPTCRACNFKRGPALYVKLAPPLPQPASDTAGAA